MAQVSEQPARGAAAAVFLMLGGYTILTQVILLRGCFSLFSGNELSVAIQLGLWLCFTAAGGALGTLMPAAAARPLLAVLPVSGLWAAVSVRILPLALPVPVGGEIPFGWAVLSLAAAQLPLNVVAGALLPTACRLFGAGREGAAIGRFYALEALGGALAGAAFTFVLAGRMRNIQVSLWMSGLAAATGAIVLWRTGKYSRYGAAAVGAALIGAAALADVARMMDDYWWRVRQPGSLRTASLETRYQRIDVGLRQGQHTVYCNGVPALALEDTEESLSGYRIADLFLSLHPEPRRVLIVGNGEPGLLARILDYPVDRVVYVLLDPAIIGIVRAIGGEGTFHLDDDRLKVVAGDGRHYLQGTDEAFDVILMDLPPPATAAGNRFFTVQAFQAARSRLLPGGLLVFQLPSSAHYIPAESQMLLSSVYRALLAAFGQVEVIAGDSMIFVAGLGEDVPPVATLAARFAAREAPVRLAQDRVIEDRELKASVFEALYGPQFDEFRQSRQMEDLRAARASPNDDSRPVAYYLNLRRWVREIGVAPALADKAFRAAENVVAFFGRHGIFCTLAAAVLIPCLLVLPARKGGPCAGRVRRGALAVAMLVSGWAGMLGELAIVFMYQSSYGQIYSAIGALFATYMMALVAGSSAAGRWCATRKSRLVWLVSTRALMIASCGVAILLSRVELAPVLFAALFLYAFALGMEYPVAARIYREDEGGRRAAGVLHSMDHLGAALATVLGGTILLPLAGAQSTLFAVGCMHLVILAALLTTSLARRPCPVECPEPDAVRR